jgi:uncharacterized lipoprotein
MKSKSVFYTISAVLFGVTLSLAGCGKLNKSFAYYTAKPETLYAESTPGKKLVIPRDMAAQPIQDIYQVPQPQGEYQLSQAPSIEPPGSPSLSMQAERNPPRNTSHSRVAEKSAETKPRSWWDKVRLKGLFDRKVPNEKT